IDPVRADGPQTKGRADGISKDREEVAGLDAVGDAEVDDHRRVGADSDDAVTGKNNATGRLSRRGITWLSQRSPAREWNGNRLELLQRSPQGDVGAGVDDPDDCRPRLDALHDRAAPVLIKTAHAPAVDRMENLLLRGDQPVRVADSQASVVTAGHIEQV